MPKKLVAMPADLKHQNAAYILNTICSMKQFTILDLTKATGISRQTIAKIMEGFLEKGLILSMGKGNSTSVGGKKPETYTLNPNRYIICVDTFVKETYCALRSFNFETLDKVYMDFVGNVTYEKYLENTVRNCRLLLARNGIETDQLYGICIGVGGVINSREGIIRFSSNFPHWGRNIPIAADLQKKLDLPVYITVDNEAKICARAKMNEPLALGKRVAEIFVDYGIAITYVDNGQVRVSPQNVDGEQGHMIIDVNDRVRCGCGACGCFESLISEQRIAARLDALEPGAKEALLEGYDPETDLRIYLMEAMDKGKEAAAESVAYMARIFGSAMRNVILGYDPDYFLLLGSFSHCTDSFLQLVEETIRENLYLQEDFRIEFRRSHRGLAELIETGSINSMLQNFLD